ncbi:MAG: hypothetical protein ACHQAZ_06800 [Gammaproteobacteria bacterium]
MAASLMLPRLLARAALIIPLLGACFTCWALLDSGTPANLSEWIVNIPWFIGQILPYAFMSIGIWKFREMFGLLMLVASGAALLTGFAIYDFMNAVILHPDAQSALLFIFIPLYQCCLFALIFVAALAVRWFSRHRRPNAA